MYVNITENTLVKMAHRLISDLWLQNKLPAGDSRCRDSPPTENMVRTAVASLRNAFGANIIFAKDSGKWFICKKCFDFKEKSRIGFASDEERAILTKADDAHKLEHRQARAHMINNARNSSNHPNLFTMILLDGTPGPTIPNWIKSARPDDMKSKFCLPWYWEIGKSYGNNQWYYFLALHWWPKGANFLIEIKYHLLRALGTSPQPHSQARTLYDQFDGGSENGNFPNLFFLSTLMRQGLFDVVQGSRLLTGHSHNEGDAAITAPRHAYDNVGGLCIGDAVRAMLSTSHGKKPTIVIVRQIHDWSSWANKLKNKDLKGVGLPHLWNMKVTPENQGFEYKNSYAMNAPWLGAGGEEGGRPVELLQPDAVLPTGPPAVWPRLENPFTESAILATKAALKHVHLTNPVAAKKIEDIIRTGGDDKSIGLTYQRTWQAGGVGFPGALSTSDGGSVPVRVLSGFPPQFWWSRPDPNNPTTNSNNPATNTNNTSSSRSSSSGLAASDSAPQPVVSDRKRKQPLRCEPWECAHCGQQYRQPKRIADHKSTCPSASASSKKRNAEGKAKERPSKRTKKANSLDNDSESPTTSDNKSESSSSSSSDSDSEGSGSESSSHTDDMAKNMRELRAQMYKRKNT